MSEPLINALENRIELGEDKTSLRDEVVSAGHSEEIFEAAYREAYIRVAEKRAEAAAQEEEEQARREAAKAAAASRVRGDLHTLKVGQGKDLVAVGVMLREGLNTAKETARYLGSAIVALVAGIAVLVMFIFVMFGAGFASFSSNAIGPGLLIIVVGVMLLYLVAVAMGVAVRFMLLRSILRRRLGQSFWSHFNWGVTIIWPAFMLTFYMQVFSNVGFALFFVPGVLAAIYFSQSAKVMASENKRGFDALARSVELVHGYFGEVLLRYLAMGGVLFLGYLAVLIPAIIMPPLVLVIVPAIIFLFYWMSCSSVILFESLQYKVPVDSVEPKKKEALKKKLKIMFTLALLLFVFFIGLSVNEELSKNSVRDIYDLPDVPVINLGRDDAVKEQREEARTAAIKQNLSTIRSQAELYWSENLSYAGVCSDPLGAYDLVSRVYDLGVGDVHCGDNVDWYLVEAELPNGSFFCVDSQANYEEVPSSRKGEESCI